MIEAVIFDWAGTTVDYGCFAPVKAFMEAFAHHGVPVTMEETRKPMGMLKRDHIRTMLNMERIAAEWKRVHGHEATEEDVDAVYAQFEPAGDGGEDRLHHRLHRCHDEYCGAQGGPAGLCPRLLDQP